MSDAEFLKLSVELFNYAKDLGITAIEEGDGADYLEELIALRLTPSSKIGCTISYSSSFAESLIKTIAKAEKVRAELIDTLSSWTDGKIVFKPSVKVDDEEGHKLSVVSLCKLIDYAEDESEVICELKSAPDGYEYYTGVPGVPLKELPLCALLKLSDAILKGNAKSYSGQECIELAERKR